VVRSSNQGGAGFDVTQHDGLRIAVRSAIKQASYGASAGVSMTAIAQQLFPPNFGHAWQAVTCVENHDIVKVGTDSRIPVLADASNQRSWYARSRSRVATGLLLTAPGIPQLFMGQEFLEDKQWSENPQNSINLLYWQGLDIGDKTMTDHLRFTQDAIRLRWRLPALRNDSVNPFHCHDQNRVLAFHRWIEGYGDDVVVVVSLNDATYYGYGIGFPRPGVWLEVFNSDVYDNWVNRIVAGNGGAIVVNGSGMHGFQTSCNIVIPANGVVVFAYNPPN
jgi:1,4-alpha-glucan branching enzyme